MRDPDSASSEVPFPDLDLPSGHSEGAEMDRDNYARDLKGLRGHLARFADCATDMALEDHLRVCLFFIEDLADYAEKVGLPKFAEAWTEEAGRYRNRLDELTMRPPSKSDAPKVMKALRITPDVYEDARGLAEQIRMTLTAYIEEAIREKNDRTANDPEWIEEVQRRAAFDLRRAERRERAAALRADEAARKRKSPRGPSGPNGP